MKTKLYLILSILLLLVFGIESKSQDKIMVSGTVTFFKNVPLNKVKVLAFKSGESTYTDSLGRFNLISFKKDILIVSASGFEKRNVKVGRQDKYIINLDYTNNPTNFKDAVSNGHISENVLQQAINSGQQKKGKDYSTYSSIFELISSEIYDVRVTGSIVYNKKIKSLNSNPQVLYVVDGKVVADISFVAPADVKTIEFVDDVSATMWGMQGANGVLKITLK
jgi:TonB-dependent starch-binding outer membrane protein SusC